MQAEEWNGNAGWHQDAKVGLLMRICVMWSNARPQPHFAFQLVSRVVKIQIASHSTRGAHRAIISEVDR